MLDNKVMPTDQKLLLDNPEPEREETGKFALELEDITKDKNI